MSARREHPPDPIDVDEPIVIEVVPITCPYAGLRLVEPLISGTCLNKHPRKCFSKRVLTEYRGLMTRTQKFRCPHCKCNLFGATFYRHYELEEVISKVGEDRKTVFYKEGRYYSDNRCTQAVTTTAPFDFGRAAKVEFGQQWDSGGPKVTIAKPPTLKRSRGDHVARDEKELKKIKVDEGAIVSRLQKNKRAYVSIKRDETDAALHEFWESVYSDFKKRFGAAVEE